MAFAVSDTVSGIDSDSGSSAGMSTMSDHELATNGWQDGRQAPIGYWRIPDDRMKRGRITMILYGQNSETREDIEAGVKLRKYGTYKTDAGQGGWQPWQDPYLAILQRNGLHEFDAQQILDLGWHRPPARNAKDSHKHIWKPIQALIDLGEDREEAILKFMPQLKGYDLKDYVCEFCPNRKFSQLAHLKNHESLMHKDHVLSRGIQEAIVNAQRENGGGQDAVAAAILELAKQLTVTKAAK